MNKNSENFSDYVRKMQLENIEIIYNMYIRYIVALAVS